MWYSSVSVSGHKSTHCLNEFGPLSTRASCLVDTRPGWFLFVFIVDYSPVRPLCIGVLSLVCLRMFSLLDSNLHVFLARSRLWWIPRWPNTHDPLLASKAIDSSLPRRAVQTTNRAPSLPEIVAIFFENRDRITSQKRVYRVWSTKNHTAVWPLEKRARFSLAASVHS